MNFSKYLKDQLLFIFAFLLAAIFIIVVIELDFLLVGTSLTISSLLYLITLELTFLAMVLIIGYLIKKPFYKRLQELTLQTDLTNMSGLNKTKYFEEALVDEAWQNLYQLATAKLQVLELENKKNIYFLSQWAHHMKTPVAVIDLLIQKNLENCSPGCERILESIREENDSLSEALTMLLNLVRLQDFTSDFHIEKVSVLELTRSIINEKKKEFVTREVYPYIEEGPNLIVESDAKWLRFVIDQLLNNALKYSACLDKPGQITMQVKTCEKGFALEIADNGIGIAKEDINRVFEPFYTGLTGRKYHKSTGMGLYLAFEICQKLGHELEIESKEGLGTKVRVCFPKKRTIFSGVI